MESKKYWILTCDTSRYDIHTLFKKDGFCLWNQRRNFEVGDVVYIYESKPVSKIVYKAIVEDQGIKILPALALKEVESRYNEVFVTQLNSVRTKYNHELIV
jgi:hypothetical protein